MICELINIQLPLHGCVTYLCLTLKDIVKSKCVQYVLKFAKERRRHDSKSLRFLDIHNLNKSATITSSLFAGVDLYHLISLKLKLKS